MECCAGNCISSPFEDKRQTHLVRLHAKHAIDSAVLSHFCSGKILVELPFVEERRAGEVNCHEENLRHGSVKVAR